MAILFPKTIKTRVLTTFKLKSEFADDETFKNLLIWANQRVKNPNAKANNADSLKANPQTAFIPPSAINCCRKRNLQPMKMMKPPDKSAHKIILPKTIKNGSEMERHIFNKALHIKGKIVNLYFISIACKANSTFKIAMNCKITC